MPLAHTIRAIAAWLIITASALGAAAQLSPEDRARDLAVEFAKLRSAATPATASMAEQEIWRIWFTGPTREVTDALAAASTAMREGAYARAEEQLTALLEGNPEHAEIWNQRAFARFLMNRFEASLEDIERTLVLEPRHFGALAGRARIEMRMGRAQKASKTMGEVGAIHPWMARSTPIPADPPPPAPVQQQEL